MSAIAEAAVDDSDYDAALDIMGDPRFIVLYFRSLSYLFQELMS